jgi:hypothetical protein
MAFTDSFPITAAGINDSNGASNSNCTTQAAKMITDNSETGFIRQTSEATGAVGSNCYAPNLLEFTRFSNITIPAGATMIIQMH